MSTPLQAVPTNHVAKGQRSRWHQALDWFDTARPLNFGQHFALDRQGRETGEPAVRLAREFDAQHQRVVWSKQYGANSAFDLSAFNTHERDMLGYLRNTAHCYHLVSATENNVTSLLRRTGGKSFDLTRFAIKTTDKGVALKQWLTWPMRVGQTRHDHLLRLPGHYLRFAKAALVALDELHERRVVHGDLNTGNWCLGASWRKLEIDGQERLRLKPDWSQVSIIDVGYSLHPSSQPRTQLPYDPQRISRYLSKAYAAVDAAGRSAFNKLPPKTRGERNWAHFTHAEFAADFWATYAPTALEAYKWVDWREDYWRLGWVLHDLRGGTQPPFSHGGAVVNALIGTPVTQDNAQAYGLAEELITWGNQDTDYDLETDLATRLAQSEVLRRATCKALLTRLDAAIAALRPEDDAEYVFLWRSDLDPHYLQQLETKKQRQTRWRTRLRHTARNMALSLGLVGVVGAGGYGWDNWAQPAWAQWQEQRQQEQQRQARAEQQRRTELAQMRAKQTAFAEVATAVSQADMGTPRWRSAIDNLSNLCRNTGAEADCTAAYTQVQQSYRQASQLIQKDPWWISGQFERTPNAAARNWLYATRMLAEQGLWLAQVQQAMVSTVAAARLLPDLAPTWSDRLAAAKQLAALVTPQQPPASAHAVTTPAELVDELREEAADLLWSLHYEGEGAKGIKESRDLAPTDLVRPVLKAVADMPAKSIQVMLAYALICWSDKPDEKQAMAYFAKAETTPAIRVKGLISAPPDQAENVARQAKAMRLAHQNGGNLCKK